MKGRERWTTATISLTGVARGPEKIIALILLFVLTSFSKPILAQSGDLWFGTDKLKHFLAAAVFTAASRHHLEQSAKLSEKSAGWTAISLTFSLSVAKEARDGWTGKGNASFKDLVADGLGMGIGILLP